VSTETAETIEGGACFLNSSESLFRRVLRQINYEKSYFKKGNHIMESTSKFSSNNNGANNAGLRNDQLNANAHRTVENIGDAARPLIDRAASGVHQTVNDLNEAADSVKTNTTQIHDKIDAAASAAKPAVDRLLTGAHQAVDKLSGLAVVAADTISEKSVQLKDAHAKLMENGRIQVREKPAVAVGIAVAAGFIIGRLFASRRN
jgi:ElaB/YqjD/DUF883 family membrane-anchored ribosome-binding protein